MLNLHKSALPALARQNRLHIARYSNNWYNEGTKSIVLDKTSWKQRFISLMP